MKVILVLICLVWLGLGAEPIHAQQGIASKYIADVGLANDPDVEYIAPDRKIAGMLDYAEPTINANIAFNSGYTGNGVTVAVIDSGILDSHPDLQDSDGGSRNTS